MSCIKNNINKVYTLPRNIVDRSWLRKSSVSFELYPTARRAAVIAPELEPANRLICGQRPRFSKTYKNCEKTKFKVDAMASY